MPQTSIFAFASRAVTLYAATIFLSAFLLFQVQPLLGKTVLPWFGGGASVWSVCLLFFQTLLLAGYAYAHASLRLRPPVRRALHLALLALAVLALPLTPDPSWKPLGGEDPTWRILGLLTASAGLPYFVLSSTGPLAQAWFARAHPGRSPYRLYALSNLGSMLALLSYPLAFEPFFSLHVQRLLWSAGFALFALLCAALAWKNGDNESIETFAAAANAPRAGDYALWIALAACASLLLLAFTAHMTLNVAAIPFLWVLPLALYLASFILCFDSARSYRRAIYLPLAALGFAAVCDTLVYPNGRIEWLIPLDCATLFAACMVCHGEIVRSKPDPRHLTGFYLAIAAGGAAGGALAGLVAPRLLPDLYELPAGMVALCLLVLIVFARQRHGLPRRTARATAASIAFYTLALGTGLAYAYRQDASGYRVVTRSFYGVLKVEDRGEGTQAMRVLSHGTIVHGKEFLDPARRDWPTTYYGRESGVARAILAAGRGARPIRVGVVGLGAGTLAAYGRAGDVFRFYDINPQVAALARSEFHFLGDSRARIEIALGDARLSLEREPAQRFDVLALDAFSSDAIPVHLLTREAFGVYLRHLAPEGILAVHVSNRYLDLAPVVAATARSHGLVAREVSNDDDEEDGVYVSDWVLLARSPAVLRSATFGDGVEDIAVPRGLSPWSDDYSDLLRILK